MSNTPSSYPVVMLSARGIRAGIVAFLPISLFVLCFALAFGAASSEAGMASEHALLMSVLHFAGAAQFAALDLWAHPLPILTLTLTVFAANARHILMGAVLAPWLNQTSRPVRWLVMSFTSDPNFGDTMIRLRTEPLDVGRLLGNGLIMWIAWIFGTWIGVYTGQALGSLKAFGLDVVILALFASLITRQWQGRPDILPTLVAAIVAIGGLTWLPAGWNIVAAALAGGLVGGLLPQRASRTKPSEPQRTNASDNGAPDNKAPGAPHHDR